MDTNEHESTQDKPCGVCAGANSSGAGIAYSTGQARRRCFKFVFIRVHSWFGRFVNKADKHGSLFDDHSDHSSSSIPLKRVEEGR
jgi:hypothetical protein